ncbi:ABC transporter ATP-binding protein [Paenibacillus sp. FSL M7-1455]|jgi:ABC-2 type transport system ATP-binding protein|uniref:ABC transporter ATP-binding protein n=1 Tax=Paenibacillus cookii TaxID=157839 RepID=A0ABQ4LST0_9BACL|nr:ABC transporter ATP-binding protein [Paenibacillus cookii]GIO66337.1 ABC transporter ATP-binding protein [Paenibacillus cookii]HWO55097.1 ABC transporter ATP-binding protein [Paenibacillus cookii]
MDALLKVNGVSKKYGKKQVLDGVSFDIGPGRLIGLLGSNGSGKSTLMQIIAGLTPASAGDISVMGRPTGRETKSLISYMPDRPMTESWMKVRDAIAFYNDFYADFDMEKAREMLDFMKLDEKSGVSILSKGMNERLQLTLALSRNVSLYLLDEPIGGVDPVARGKILDAIVRFYREDSSLIISTHLVGDMERIFDEVMFLRDGRIVLHEEVENIRMKHGRSVDDMFKEVFGE